MKNIKTSPLHAYRMSQIKPNKPVLYGALLIRHASSTSNGRGSMHKERVTQLTRMYNHTTWCIVCRIHNS